ncbi:NADP-dependent dehydrogenase-like protein [Hypomontagnella monticulosa]|nr:NADP-dependent dehydrogenase-like protein [Hypomontagnella monticulosa]
MSSFPYKKVLLIGATSGIGLELAEQLVQKGVYVISVGRRQSRLDSFVSAHGSSKAAGVAFDIAEIAKIPSFAETVIKQHPDLDCIVLNAGVQYVMDFSKPHTVDMAKIQNEININYIAMVGITHAFMPFFQANSINKEVAFIYTTTSLMSMPYPMVLNYSASKAALHAFIICIREQFKQKPESKINTVELVVPLVQTELHDGQPGWSPDFNPGMPVKQFVSESIAGFEAKEETVAIGQAKQIFDEFELEKGRRVGPVWEMIKKNMGKAHTFD